MRMKYKIEVHIVQSDFILFINFYENGYPKIIVISWQHINKLIVGITDVWESKSAERSGDSAIFIKYIFPVCHNICL